jgi:hypothetical protein
MGEDVIENRNGHCSSVPLSRDSLKVNVKGVETRDGEYPHGKTDVPHCHGKAWLALSSFPFLVSSREMRLLIGGPKQETSVGNTKSGGRQCCEADSSATRHRLRDLRPQIFAQIGLKARGQSSFGASGRRSRHWMKLRRECVDAVVGDGGMKIRRGGHRSWQTPLTRQ